MERIDEARTTAAMQPEPSARGAAHRPQSNPPAAPRFHHPTHQESRQAARVYEGAARVGEEHDQKPGYHSELTQSTKSRACAQDKHLRYSCEHDRCPEPT